MSTERDPARRPQPATLQLLPPTLIQHRPPVEQEIATGPKSQSQQAARVAHPRTRYGIVSVPQRVLPVKRAPAFSSQKPSYTALLDHVQGALRATL